MASTTECEEFQSFLGLAACLVGSRDIELHLKKLKDHLVRTPGQAYPNFSPAVHLSAQLRRSWGFPVVPTVDLHVLPSFAVLCQSMNFVRKGGFSGLISFAAYSLNRILCPPGLGLPCVRWYRA